MNSVNKLLVLSLILVFTLTVQNTFSQNVDYNNRVEYAEDESSDDLGTIKVSEKTTKKEAPKELEKKRAVSDRLTKLLDNRRHHQTRRKPKTKRCYKAEENPCD